DEGYEKEEAITVDGYLPATANNVKAGAAVFVESLQNRGTVLSFNPKKNEAEVVCGSIKMRVGLNALKLIPAQPQGKKAAPAEKVKVVRKFSPTQQLFEINVIGMNVEEALEEVENFLDKALTDNLEQVKIIHGVGTGKLRAAIAQRLKRHRGVKEFRAGAYGEGEIGVTIVTLGK
ncbi:MAG: Smr/MutS family protein, partial [Clostridia bacterium]|nr:Smr/MutS family protein [Clostridia bacterium]